MGGRGAVSSLGSSGYVQGYINNNPWLENLNDESKKAMIDNFKSMSSAEQYYYSLNSAEQTAISNMQINTKALNNYMSGRTTDISAERKAQFDADIKNAKSAISKFNSPKPATLYRGVGEKEFNSIKTGGKTDSFKSTSTDHARANAFTENQGGYIVEFKTSKKTRVADVNGAPGANEKEWLLDSGVTYKSVKKISARHIVVEI